MNTSKQIINNHNKRILKSSQHIDYTADNTSTKDTKTCSCQRGNTCLRNGNCLQSLLIYQATITHKDNGTTETYIGLTENDFKTRNRTHTTSFWHSKHRNSTELSKHIWTLKENNIDHFIYGTSFHQDHPTTVQAKDATSASKKNYFSSTNLKYHRLINVTELVSLCHHRNKALLCNSWTKHWNYHALTQICIIGVDMLIIYNIYI